MDGTLIDSEPYWIAAEQELAAEHGMEWTHADGLTLVGNPLDVSAQVFIDRGVDLPADQIIDRWLNQVASHVAAHVPWQNDARELLDEVHAAGIPCALVTMSYGAMTQAFLDAAPGIFDVVVTGDEVTHGKPDPESYLLAAERLGVDVTRCVAIEDSPAGTRAAFSSGAATISVRRIAPIPPMPGLTRVKSLAGIGVEGLTAVLAGQFYDELGDVH